MARVQALPYLFCLLWEAGKNSWKSGKKLHLLKEKTYVRINSAVLQSWRELLLKHSNTVLFEKDLELLVIANATVFSQTEPSFSLSARTMHRVRTLFWTKTSRTFQGLSRTHFAFFKDSIQCKKEPWVYVFFSSTTTWAILSWRSFILGTWESGLDKVSTEIQGLSSTDCNFQGLSRPWTFYFKFQGLSRTFKELANPVCMWYRPDNNNVGSLFKQKGSNWDKALACVADTLHCRHEPMV